ncbi:MAG: glycosyltransferase family 2 protein [Planctomycetia bacterium]|nr:glycosyltransferase family 2 protein [Planctomycetia bacterium]
MTESAGAAGGTAGAKVPVAVVMISLNEGHNMAAVLENLAGWAQEVFLVDSYSTDDTVDIALRHGVHVVQRRFRGFGDQWNFALRELPIKAPWTMKLDPDERLTDRLKASIAEATARPDVDGIRFRRRLWFMGRPMPVRQTILRAWRTGKCRFTDVTVNEQPVVEGRIADVPGDLEHHDSPDLHHWCDKQNRYISAEAIAQFEKRPQAAEARLFGDGLERRRWLRRAYWWIPGRYTLMFLYHLLVLGAWQAGRVGWIWSRLRTELFRTWAYKLYEMRLRGVPLRLPPSRPGQPDPRVKQYD